jgi:hypothetical protein
MRSQRGTTLIELMVTVGVFSFLVISLFALMRDGTRNWRAVETRTSVQASMHIAERDITTELKRASYGSVVIDQSSYKHALLFKSAMNETDNLSELGDPLKFIVDETHVPPAPKWQRYVLYYVTRPSTTEHVSTYGFACQSPSGTTDDICPHKMLVRKDIYLSAGDSGATAPILDSSNHVLNPFIESSEPGTTELLGEVGTSGQAQAVPAIARVRILAKDILSFNLGVFQADGTTSVALSNNKLPSGAPCLIEFDLKAFKMTEAAQVLHVGTDPLVTYDNPGAPNGTAYQTAKAPFSIQLDNRVQPQNP